MNFSATFIRRPVATSLLMLGIAMFGLIAYRALPVSDLPSVDFPTIMVSASLPGADPATMASAVATPLERQFTTISGIDSMTSVNSLGSTQITLQFDLSRKIDGAAVDVQTAIAAAMPLLPPGLTSPPSFRKVNPADSPIIFLTVSSPTLPLWVVDEYAENKIAQRISMVDGVAQVQVLGAQKYAVHVRPDPTKLQTRQIGIDEVARAVTSWNVNQPTGTLWGPHTAYNVLANGQLMNAAGYRDLVVAWRNGSPVRLGDIGQTADSVEEERTAAWIYTPDGGRRAINLMIMRQPGSNVIEVTDGIKRLLPTIQAQLPPAIHLEIRADRSANIRQAFGDVRFTMMLTLVLVIAVIFAFLRNVSATLIPALALPFSIVGAFSVMYLLDFSLDNLSMMALILCIGFVVDDAIVMLENIVRHMERGEAPMEAALAGSREIWFTIVSMTLSLAAVFIPILFMGGILGRLFREFAVTICVAILISGFVSVSLTPMLCSRILKRDTGPHGAFYRAADFVLKGMAHLYEGSLRWVLNHRPVMAGAFLATLGLTTWLYIKVPKGFIPDTDNDQIYVTTEMAQGTSFATMSKYQQQVAEVLRRDPNIDGLMSNVGGGYGSTSNTGRIFLQLKPRRQRALTSAQVLETLRPKLARFPGVRVFMTLPQAIRVGGRSSKSTYQFTLQSADTHELYIEAGKLTRQLGKLSSIQDVSSDLEMKTPRVRVDIDRERAAALAVDARTIERSLYNAYGPSWVSTIYTPNNQFRVLLELLPGFQEHADMVTSLFMHSSSGKLVPLEAITTLREDVGPQSINHSGQLPSVTVSFNLRPGVSLGDAVADVEEVAAHNLPASVSTSFTGTAKVFQDSLKNLGLLLLIAILIVYIVLGVLYESFIHPLTILSGLPSAGFGALLTLLIFRVELTIYAFVGLIMLIGIVKKNAIMQIDFALEAERKRGMTAKEAIYAGCLTRFRPIMMTTLAALFGSLPIALGFGAGGEARRPLGLTVVGGLAFSQLLTLYLTPVVYTYMAGLLDYWRRRHAPAAVAGGPLLDVKP